MGQGQLRLHDVPHRRNAQPCESHAAIEGRPTLSMKSRRIRENDDNAEVFPEQIPTPAPVDPERLLLERDLDRQVRQRFKNDAVVLLVYEAFLERMKPVDIRSCLGITENQYHAAAKRLRRTVRALVEGRSR